MLVTPSDTKGRTSLRAEYSVHFVNDDTIASILNDIESPNQGLVGQSFDIGLSGTLSVNRPAIPKPIFKIPRKQWLGQLVRFGNSCQLHRPRSRCVVGSSFRKCVPDTGPVGRRRLDGACLGKVTQEGQAEECAIEERFHPSAPVPRGPSSSLPVVGTFQMSGAFGSKHLNCS